MFASDDSFLGGYRFIAEVTFKRKLLCNATHYGQSWKHILCQRT